MKYVFFLSEKCPKCNRQTLFLVVDWKGSITNRIFCDNVNCDYEEIDMADKSYAELEKF